MQCNCRLQIADMGHYKCQLTKGHKGDHSYFHDGKSWPKRKYSITWEQDTDRDIIFREEMLKDTNINEVFENIKEKFNIIEIEYNYEDDAIHGSTPSIWINAKWHKEIVDTDDCYEIIWNLESEIRKYIDSSLLYNDRLMSSYDELLDIHFSIY